MLKKVLPLSGILSLRFLGLFLVLPVLSAYALHMKGSTPLLVGIIVGGYALTQAIFQLPFGLMSDKIGRKPTIAVGLIIFFIGSVIAASTHDIYWLMAGRFLQGAGAIGSVIVAMISDLVEENVRGKAMAMMGSSIALSFAAAMILGPILGGHFGVNTLFWIAAILAILAVGMLFTNVPNPPKIRHIYHNTSTTSDILKDTNLSSMILIDGMQKGLMTMAFVIIPIILTSHTFDWSKTDLWKAYVPAMILGLIAMGPAAVFGEKYNKPRQIFLVSILLFVLAFILMGFTHSGFVFVLGVISFFLGFNMMEPLVQSMISKFAKVHQRGAALGIANSFSYFMTFIGGTAAGLLLNYTDREVLGSVTAIVALLWFAWTYTKLQNPTQHSHLYLPESEVDMDKLNNLEGEHIAEWYINDTEKLVVVKYVTAKIAEEDVKAMIMPNAKH